MGMQMFKVCIRLLTCSWARGKEDERVLLLFWDLISIPLTVWGTVIVFRHRVSSLPGCTCGPFFPLCTTDVFGNGDLSLVQHFQGLLYSPHVNKGELQKGCQEGKKTPICKDWRGRNMMWCFSCWIENVHCPGKLTGQTNIRHTFILIGRIKRLRTINHL